MIKKYPYILFIPLIIVLSLSFLLIPQVYAERGVVVNPNDSQSTERRIALVIGNSAYKSSPLKNPVNDAEDMATTLTKLGFQVSLGKDMTRKEMRKLIRQFGDELKRGGVGLFYYAGHGMQVKGKNYLIPVGTDIQAEFEVEDEAVDAGLILRNMENAGNTMNMVFLDACRNNPFARSFRSATRGLAQMDAPSGSLIVYATAPGSVAADGSGRNGIFTKNLLAYLETPGLPVNQMLMSVRKAVRLETDGKQTPWESSSLEGNFYFVPGSKAADDVKLMEERKKLAEERLKLKEERERIKKEQGKEKVASLTPSVPEDSLEGKRSSDGRYIDHGDGTITDTKTNLMWTKKDSYADTGSCMNWNNSRNYVSNLSAGGYSDWRIPTVMELKTIFEKSKNNKDFESSTIHSDPIFAFGGAYWYWSSETAIFSRFRSVDFRRGSVGGDFRDTCRNLGVRAVRR